MPKRSRKSNNQSTTQTEEAATKEEELEPELDEEILEKDENITVNIQNVVASVDLYFKINLEKTATVLMYSSEVSYIPEQFPGLVVKIKEPKTSALVFSSGKMVITGAKSAAEIKEAVAVLRKKLKESSTSKGPKNKTAKITVQNIVASGNIGFKIDLELAALLLENSMYEPEQFPGLIYRLKKPKTVLLLFQTGDVVCTGAKKELYVYQAVKHVKDDLASIEALIEDE
jgi:transcription initiation factor TFIID TATA-box-binding protein